MRIIDNRNDYYDIGMGLGYDASLIYLRSFKEIYHFNNKMSDKHYDPLVVGFCGKLYPAVRLFHTKWDYNTTKTTSAFCYSLEEADKFAQNNYDSQKMEFYENNYHGKRKFFGGYSRLENFNRCDLVDYFNQFETIYKDFKEKFTEYNCPIFVYDNKHLYINPILYGYEFYRVFDAYTAWQEVSMYVGGVLLSKTNPIPEVSDEVRLESHGFDKKYSFRKEKSKK
jgi:hypothetical protein